MDGWLWELRGVASRLFVSACRRNKLRRVQVCFQLLEEEESNRNEKVLLKMQVFSGQRMSNHYNNAYHKLSIVGNIKKNQCTAVLLLRNSSIHIVLHHTSNPTSPPTCGRLLPIFLVFHVPYICRSGASGESYY